MKDKARFLPPAGYVNEQNYTKVHFSTDEEIDSSSTKRSSEVVEGGGWSCTWCQYEKGNKFVT